MAILVVGGAGYIGSHTVRFLEDAGRDVWVLDNLCKGHARSVREDRLIRGDLMNPADLEAALTRLLGSESFDAVIHAAAVSDFGVEAVMAGGVEHPPGAAKLDSATPPTIRLRRHPKLVGRLHALSCNLALTVVAFKLTVGADAAEVEAAVKSLLERAGADLVVHNDLEARDQAGRFPATVYGPGFTTVAQCPDRGQIGEELERYLQRASATPAAPR